MIDKLDFLVVFLFYLCFIFGVGILGMLCFEFGRNMDIIVIYYFNLCIDFFLIKMKDCFIKID